MHRSRWQSVEYENERKQSNTCCKQLNTHRRWGVRCRKYAGRQPRSPGRLSHAVPILQVTREVRQVASLLSSRDARWWIVMGLAGAVQRRNSNGSLQTVGKCFTIHL